MARFFFSWMQNQGVKESERMDQIERERWRLFSRGIFEKETEGRTGKNKSAL